MSWKNGNEDRDRKEHVEKKRRLGIAGENTSVSYEDIRKEKTIDCMK